MFNMKRRQKTNPPPSEDKGGQKLVEGEEIILSYNTNVKNLIKQAEERIKKLKATKTASKCGC